MCIRDSETEAGKIKIAVNGGIIQSSDPAVSDMAGLLYVTDQKLSQAREKGNGCVVK